MNCSGKRRDQKSEGLCMMEKIGFQIHEKEITLYPAQGANRPLIIWNTVMGDGESIFHALRDLNAPECNLLVAGKLQWYHDMTPWSCPPLSKNDPPAYPDRCGFRSSGNMCSNMS